MITYDILRHANAPRNQGIYTDWKADSQYRNLSAWGVSQARTLGKMYRNEKTNIILGLHSTAPRTMYTLGISTAHVDISLIEVPELFTPEGKDGDILNPAFEKFGNDLHKYMFTPVLFEALARFGRKAAQTIRSIQATHIPDLTDGVIVIANHAVTGNFVAWALAEGENDSLKDKCLYTGLGEAERLRLTPGSVEHIKLES